MKTASKLVSETSVTLIVAMRSCQCLSPSGCCLVLSPRGRCCIDADIHRGAEERPAGNGIIRLL